MIGHVVGPYQIVARLGSGGMGDVYLADDPRLERKVALKCPSDEWLSQPDARERLRREARAAARLKHDNIAAIYDVLDVDDRPFIVMEYVEGKGLNECLRHERLSVEQALQIGIQIADAVAEAHTNGVLHRDLKPGNIRLTTSGRVKVLDFGLAKVKPVRAEVGERPSIEASLTVAGQMLGTPGYAAPEQLTGRTADQRSDIFAIGVILFEMLTGRLPFSGADPMSVALSTVTDPAPSVRTLNHAVPLALAGIISRALEKNPKERFPTSASLAAELRRVAGSLAERPTTTIAESWAPANPPVAPPTVRLSPRLVGGVVAGILAILGLVAGMQWIMRQQPKSPAAVVLVLPFEFAAGDESLTAAAAGLGDTLTTDLTGLPGIIVVPRGETLKYRGPGRSASAPREQGASFIVQGALAPAGENLALDLVLTATDGRGILWHRRYVGPPIDLERRAREDLAMAFRGPLGMPQSFGAGGTLDALAFDHYSQARALLERTDVPENIGRAVELLVSATQRDPQYALAYLALGGAYWERYRMTRDTALSVSARDALIKAQALQPNHPEVHYQLAVFYNNTGETDDAINELNKALQENPDNHVAHRLLGRIYFDRSEVDAGIAELRKAIAIRPDFVGGYLNLGAAAYRSGRDAEAEAAFRKATELQPESPAGYLWLGILYHKTKRLPEAEENYKTAVRLGAGSQARNNLATMYYEMGRYEEAAETYQRLAKEEPGNALYWRNLGDALLKTGERRPARDAYEQAIVAGARALSVNPKDARTLSQTAVCEAKLGRADQARLHAQQALDLSPRDSQVLYHFAVVSALGGDRPAALDYLGRAIKEGYPATFAAHDEDLAPIAASAEFRKLVAPKL